MKNTKSGKIQFGNKAYIEAWGVSDRGTGIATTCKIEVKTAKLSKNKVSSRKMVNFDERRKNEVYRRINAKFGEG